MTSISIDAADKYLLGGNVYSGHQLQRAIHCAHSVARAYAIADVANGGSGRVDPCEIDDAQREAIDAMGAHAMHEIVDSAREYNDVLPPSLQTQSAASLLTEEETAEACIEGWSLRQNGQPSADNAALAFGAEISSIDAGEGA